jgi:hypothetical protein
MKELRIQRGHPLEKPVFFCYDKDLILLARFDNLVEASNKTGVHRSILSKYLGTDKVWRNKYVF